MTAEPLPAPHPGTLEIRSPLTGEVVGTVPIATVADVDTAVSGAWRAFERWGRLTHGERRPPLRAYVRTVLRNMDRIADVLRAETGKDRGEAMAEVTAALTAMDYFARNAGKILKRRKGRSWPFPTTKGWIEYHPRGVAAVISPWNYPFYLTMLSTIQALAAGNTVVIKPSEVTPHSGALVAELAVETGLGEDVVQVVHGPAETGEALVRSNPSIIAFTGSSLVGKRVAAIAAETLKPVILELGANDAMVVLEDADVRRAARAAVTHAMLNAGQTCVAVERVYVVDEIYDRFVAEATAAVGKLNAGKGDAGDIGPFIDASQAEVVERHLSEATAKGAEVIVGGARVESDHGVYFEPTLLVDVDHTMEVMREETFGPVLPVARVRDEDEAVALANDSVYGLHGSVWTKNKRRGALVAGRMKTGTVAINDHLINFFFPSIPLGGIDDSGYGGHLGDEGLRNFSITKSITSARIAPTTWLMGGWLPRRVGPRWWKTLARVLFGWRR